MIDVIAMFKNTFKRRAEVNILILYGKTLYNSKIIFLDSSDILKTLFIKKWIIKRFKF